MDYYLLSSQLAFRISHYDHLNLDGMEKKKIIGIKRECALLQLQGSSWQCQAPGPRSHVLQPSTFFCLCQGVVNPCIKFLSPFEIHGSQEPQRETWNVWGRQFHLIYIHNNLIFDAWVNSQLVKGIVAANGRSFACACRGIITVRWEHVYPTWILGILDWETSKTTRFEPTDILFIRGQKWHCPPSQCPPLTELLYIPPHPLPIFFTPLHLTPALAWN